jgi:hypothetical protein
VAVVLSCAAQEARSEMQRRLGWQCLRLPPVGCSQQGARRWGQGLVPLPFHPKVPLEMMWDRLQASGLKELRSIALHIQPQQHSCD